MLLNSPIKTERLLLRPIAEADAQPLHQMDTDPAVMRYIGDGQPKPWGPEQGLEMLRRGIERWATSRYGWLAIVEKQTECLVGTAGLQFDPDLDAMELGYKTVRSAWGKGYAAEACRAMLAYGVEQLDLLRVVSEIQEGNVASIRVAEKLGMKHVSSHPHPRIDRMIRLYALDRPRP